MTAPRTKVWSIEPHTRAKHDLLSRYLKAWYPIIGRYSQRAVFIDAFAGPGVYEDGSPGSPIIALRTLLDHSALGSLSGCTFYFLFIESDKKRFAHLEAEIKKLDALPGNVQVMLRNSNFVTVAEELASLINDEKQGLAPTLAFLDPFGISGVPLNLIAQLLASDKCELFITFMADHLNRFARTGQIDRHCEELFGSDDYRNVRGMTALIDLYERQLHDVAKFTYVREFEMLRTDGHPAYYLIHATRSEKGVGKMKDAMWKVDPGSGFSFSDRHAGQGSLLVGDHVDTGPLRAALVANFAGKTASIEQLERFTLLETLYHPSSHLRRKTLALMEADDSISVINPGTKRRKGDYPAGTEIKFAK